MWILSRIYRKLVPETLRVGVAQPRNSTEKLSLLHREILWQIGNSYYLERWAERKLKVAPYYWLFILGVNNSGTTILSRILESHPDIRALPHEGQKLSDALPRPDDEGLGRIWGSQLERFHWTERSPKGPAVRAKFDWSRLYPNKLGALLEKSPPNTVRSRWIQKYFHPCRFIAIVRSPYAVCEGIRRRTECDIATAAKHWKEANRCMLSDMTRLDHCLLLSYEDLCSDRAEQMIKRLQDYLQLSKPFDMKTLGTVEAHSLDGTTKGLQNLNDKSTASLTTTDIETINNCARHMIIKLGYSLM
jgi:hypothetical protein